MTVSSNNKKILIFIPAYNVEKKIYSVVSNIPHSIFEKNKITLLIINDYSNDKTNFFRGFSFNPTVIGIAKSFLLPYETASVWLFG